MIDRLSLWCNLCVLSLTTSLLPERWSRSPVLWLFEARADACLKSPTQFERRFFLHGSKTYKGIRVIVAKILPYVNQLFLNVLSFNYFELPVCYIEAPISE
jgi:hypothetical protein